MYIGGTFTPGLHQWLKKPHQVRRDQPCGRLAKGFPRLNHREEKLQVRNAQRSKAERAMPLAPPDKEKLQSVGRRNDVSLLGLFGSTARGDATRKSDVDVMARFSKRKSLLDLVRIEREMSDALGRKVDLLTEASISPHLRDRIFDEMIVLYEAPGL